jgi:hypothetical protein
MSRPEDYRVEIDTELSVQETRMRQAQMPRSRLLMQCPVALNQGLWLTPEESGECSEKGYRRSSSARVGLAFQPPVAEEDDDGLPT